MDKIINKTVKETKKSQAEDVFADIYKHEMGFKCYTK